MDPLTAVSLTANVFQLVSFSGKFISLAKEIHSSATRTKKDVIELDVMLKDLDAILISLGSSWNQEPTRRNLQNDNLFEVLIQCQAISKELGQILADLQCRRKQGKADAIYSAVKHLVKEGRIRELEGRLGRLQRQIDSHILVDIRSHQASINQWLQTVIQTSQRLETNRADDLAILKSSIDRRFDGIENSIRAVSQAAEKDETVGRLARWLSGVGLGGKQTILGEQCKVASDGLLAVADQIRLTRGHAAEQSILKSLAFKEMVSRQRSIKDAHQATFLWVFEPDSKRPSSAHIQQWLEHGEGIFWISGKPGSGKSTLMKYIYNDKRTLEKLTLWAGNAKLVIASFYFWNSGSSIQRSIDGLVRSLLFQVLKQCPELIPSAFPDVWSEIEQWSIREYYNLNAVFRPEDLHHAIHSLKAATNLGVKFCFFVDGLDEYEGFGRHIAGLLAGMTASGTIKLCVASRPHNVFLDFFGRSQDQMLYVHEYTEPDIREYVQVVLHESSEFIARQDADPAGYQGLVDYITKNANGVFLWVYLVVASVLNGLENADRMSDLQRKVQGIPTDLKSLFKHILDSVEEDYYDQQARMLLMASEAHVPLGLMTFSFADEDPDFVFRSQFMKGSRVGLWGEEMRKRIVGRCKLLLEVTDSPSEDDYFGHCVTFLHRTVRDYVKEKEGQRLMIERLRKPFDARLYIVKALLAQICYAENSYLLSKNLKPLRGLLVQLLRHVKAIEELDHASPVRILDDMIPLLTVSAASSSAETSRIGRHADEQPEDKISPTVRFLRLAIYFDLQFYVKAKVQDMETEDLDALLDCALRPDQFYDFGDGEQDRKPEINPEIVSLLLEHGANPDSAWASFDKTLIHDASFRSQQSGPAYQVRFQTLKKLVEAGADVNYTYEPFVDEVGRTYSTGYSAEKQGGIISSREIITKLLQPRDAQTLFDIAGNKPQTWLEWLGWKPLLDTVGFGIRSYRNVR